MRAGAADFIHGVVFTFDAHDFVEREECVELRFAREILQPALLRTELEVDAVATAQAIAVHDALADGAIDVVELHESTLRTAVGARDQQGISLLVRQCFAARTTRLSKTDSVLLSGSSSDDGAVVRSSDIFPIPAPLPDPGRRPRGHDPTADALAVVRPRPSPPARGESSSFFFFSAGRAMAARPASLGVRNTWDTDAHGPAQPAHDRGGGSTPMSPTGDLIRVAIFAPSYQHGVDSSAVVIRELVRYFRQQQNVVWKVFAAEPPPEDGSLGDDVSFGLEMAGDVVLGEGASLPYLQDYDCRSCLELKGHVLHQLARFRPEVVHLTEPCMLSLQVLQWARRHKVPAMATVHGDMHAKLRFAAASSGPPGAIFLFMFERFLHNFYCQVPRLFVASAHAQSELWTAGHWQPGVNEASAWGATADLGRFSPRARSTDLRAALGAASNDTTLILWLGSATPEAETDAWAQTISRLHAEEADVVGVVVGAGAGVDSLVDASPRVCALVHVGHDRWRLRARGRRSYDGVSPPRTPRVEASPVSPGLGFAEAGEGGMGASGSSVALDVATVIASCDVLLMPACHDPYCSHLLRALACGLAVVTDTEALVKLADLSLGDVETAVTAVPQTPGDSEAFFTATATLVRDRTLRTAFGSAGRRVLQQALGAPGTVGVDGEGANGMPAPPRDRAPAMDPWLAHFRSMVVHYRESIDLGRLRPPRPLRLDWSLHNAYWQALGWIVAGSARLLQQLRGCGLGGGAVALGAQVLEVCVLLLLPIPLVAAVVAYVPVTAGMAVLWCVEGFAPESLSLRSSASAAASAWHGAQALAAAVVRAARPLYAAREPGREPVRQRRPRGMSFQARQSRSNSIAQSVVAAGELVLPPPTWRRARACCLGVVAAVVGVLAAYLVLVALLQAHTSKHMWQQHEFWCHDVRGDCERRIPFIIHQMYKNEALPEAWAETPARWQRMNPGYKYMLWTDQELEELIATHYPWFLPVYRAYPNNIQRSDSSRYFLLHRYGGVYADLDIVATRSIDRLIAGERWRVRGFPRGCVLAASRAGHRRAGHEALLPLTPNIGITNAVMASTPGHDFFSFVTNELGRYSKAWYHLSRHVTIVSSTGPTFLWSAFLHYRGAASIALVPSDVWGKCTVCHPQCAEVAGSFFRHLSGGSWHTADSKAINNAILCHPILLMILGALVASAALRRVLWLPLTSVICLYAVQDHVDIDMWFAPFAWLMGLGAHPAHAEAVLSPAHGGKDHDDERPSAVVSTSAPITDRPETEAADGSRRASAGTSAEAPDVGSQPQPPAGGLNEV